MNCYKCKQLIDKIHIDCVNNNELQSVLRHIDECEECRTYYNVMKGMIEGLNSFEEKELPEGFHNRLHFALKREAEKPADNKKSHVKGLKIAAIGACSVLVVLAAVSLLPKRMYDAMPNMAMEEAVEESPRDYLEAEAEVQSIETAEAAEMPMADAMEEPSEESAENFGAKNALDGDAPAECEDDAENTATSCASLLDAGSMVLIINAEDINAVYEELLPYFPDNLPETSWAFEDIEEPDEYLQLRQLMDRDVAQHLAGDLASEYARSLDLYASRMIEYDNWTEEIADLQNVGYIFIIIK